LSSSNLLHASPPPAASVLLFWRCFGSGELTAVRRARVEAFVTKAAIADRRWPLAAAGNAAAAIGIALSRHDRILPDLQFDVAMTAVLFCALRGDPAARVVLAAMVRHHGGDRVSERVAASWTAAPSDAGRGGEA
jgi:hypothetical protein